MNDGNKWIKLHSKLLNWEWYKVQNTKDVFIHLLLKANWKDGKFQGHDIPRGSVVTGRKQLAEELSMTEQEVRTSLNHLKSTNEITIISTKKFSIITVVNYELYQQSNQVFNQQLTNNQPTTNQQVTTIEEYKNNRIIDDIDNCSSYIEKNYARTISTTEYEKIKSWCNEFDIELIKYAVDISILQNVKNFKYIQGILNNWKSAGYKTKQEVIKHENRHIKQDDEQEEEAKLFDYNWLEDD